MGGCGLRPSLKTAPADVIFRKWPGLRTTWGRNNALT